MGIETSHFKTEKLSEYTQAMSDRRKKCTSGTPVPRRENNRDKSNAKKYPKTPLIGDR